MSEPGPVMGFLDHLEELRRRLFWAAVALVPCAVAGYIFSGPVLAFLTRPAGTLVFVAPTEAFVTRLKVALALGAIVASPVIIYQFWRFVRPALLPGEARAVALAAVFSVLCFGGGVTFATLVILPIGMRFFLSFESERLQAMISIGRYVDFASGIVFAAGLVFLLPVVMYFLARFGVVTPKLLRKGRRVAIVLILVAAAVLTPPDIFTQLLLAVPLVLLYELSILVAALATRRRARAQSDSR